MSQYEIYDIIKTKPNKWWTKLELQKKLGFDNISRVGNAINRLRKANMVHRKLEIEESLNKKGIKQVKRVFYYKITPIDKKIRNIFDDTDKLEYKNGRI